MMKHSLPQKLDDTGLLQSHEPTRSFGRMRSLRWPAAPDLASRSYILVNHSDAGATLGRADSRRDARGPSAHDQNVESFSGIVIHPSLLPCWARTRAGRFWNVLSH